MIGDKIADRIAVPVRDARSRTVAGRELARLAPPKIAGVYLVKYLLERQR